MKGKHLIPFQDCTKEELEENCNKVKWSIIQAEPKKTGMGTWFQNVHVEVFLAIFDHVV